jgi:hypothetical protein
MADDRSGEVTVFLTTVGASTFDAALASVKAQDCSFSLSIIECVAPLSAALQQMIEECRTPYYVQVDEDMVLEPSAVRVLHEAIRETRGDVAVVVGYLWDTHLDAAIQGIKIFRHEVAERFPWSRFPQVVQRNRAMEEEGFSLLPLSRQTTAEPWKAAWIPSTDVRRVGTLGRHDPAWTPATLYERYYLLGRLHQADPARMAWVANLPRQLVARLGHTAVWQDWYALMGLVAGQIAGPMPAAPVRDFHSEPDFPGFESATEMWHTLGGNGSDG